MPRVLVVDDEPDIVTIVRRYLEREQFEVIVARDGAEALEAFDRRRPDLVLLDLMLPSVDGRDVCRRIRAGSRVPIIMLTARDAETDKILGLELGADDYITKPASPREIVARVRAALRRSTWGPSAEVLRAGPVMVDLKGHLVEVDGRGIDLTSTEFALLANLVRHHGQVLTRLQLLEGIESRTFEGFERTIDSHIQHLRAKIEPDPGEPRYVVTVRGVGYKFETDSPTDE
jgi:DNA-binding response OmpR family regulator